MLAPLALPLQLPLAKSAIDRAAHHRANESELEELWLQAKIAHFNGEKYLVDESGLKFLPPTQLTDGERYFLGKDKDGTPYFLFHPTNGW